jgi:uridine kinase
MNNGWVEVRYRGELRTVTSGTRLDDFLISVDHQISDRVMAALVNRRLVMLDFPLRGKAELDLVLYGSREGEAVYKRSVSLLLYEACCELFPTARLVIGQSLGNCYHYQVRGIRTELEEMASALMQRMQELHEEKRIFVRQTVTIEEAEDFFEKRGNSDKLQLLSTHRSSTVHTITCGDFVDIAHGPYAPHTGCLPTFGVRPYEDGLLLLFPRRRDRDRLPDFSEPKLLFRTYTETRSWQELLGVHHVGQLNRLCLNGGIKRILLIAEGLHEKKIAEIADQICRQRDRLRLVTVAGPSSSGKTTFAKRLDIQMRVNGIEPVSLSLDNYYVDREQTPRDEDGNLDFESIEAIDLQLFHQHLADLLAGREVLTPRFDFVAGQREPESKWKPFQLQEDQILTIEGIHGLNPRLTDGVEQQQLFRIYISALTQLAIDDHNRIFTADARLIRRIVRDRLFRGFTAQRSLEIWKRVRLGEAKWIFPFQEDADVMFNSALVYETAVLQTYATRFLLQVPKTHPTYTEAYRLLKFLSMFVPVFPDEVPHTSILREFIGGSAFRY